jgi:hypothetical protein
MSKDMQHEVAEYAVRAGPGLGVGSMSFAGFPLQEWVLLATLVYTVLQIGWFIWSRIRGHRK